VLRSFFVTALSEIRHNTRNLSPKFVAAPMSGVHADRYAWTRAAAPSVAAKRFPEPTVSNRSRSWECFPARVARTIQRPESQFEVSNLKGD